MADSGTPTKTTVELVRPAPRTERPAAEVTGPHYELGSATLSFGPSAGGAMAHGDREALLASLYEERRMLLRAKRLGRLSAADEEYLTDLSKYIDRWEAPETPLPSSDDLMRKLEALTASLLGVQAKIARQQE